MAGLKNLGPVLPWKATRRRSVKKYSIFSYFSRYFLKIYRIFFQIDTIFSTINENIFINEEEKNIFRKDQPKALPRLEISGPGHA